MTDFLQNALVTMQSLGKDSPIIAGAISLYGLGLLTYLLKGVPKSVFEVAKKHVTTSVTIANSHEAFYNLMVWLEEKGYSSKFRRVKLTNGRWGGDESATKGVGYGSHLIWYEGWPLILSLLKEESKDVHVKETLILTKLGRGHQLFDRMIGQFLKTKAMGSETLVYSFNDHFWEIQQRQRRRDLETIFLDSSCMETLVRTLQDFGDREQWYIDHDIPYRLGILLYGPPGTGKTSLIKGIASYTGKKLCVLPAAKLAFLLRAVEKLPDDSVIVIEDVDSHEGTHHRKSMFQDSTKKDDFDINKLFAMADGGLSEILNAIDGIADTHGRILILTTNEQAELDPALLRPGRVDLQLEIGYVTNEVFVDFMTAFFPGCIIPEFTMKPQISVAELQQAVLTGKNPHDILETFTVMTSLRSLASSN